MHIMIGTVTTLPGFTEGDRVTDDNVSDYELVDRLIENKRRAIIEFKKIL